MDPGCIARHKHLTLRSTKNLGNITVNYLPTIALNISKFDEEILNKIDALNGSFPIGTSVMKYPPKVAHLRTSRANTRDLLANKGSGNS